MNIHPYTQMIYKWLLTSGIPILLILVFMKLAFKFADMLIEKYFSNVIKSGGDGEIEKRIHTLKSAIKSIVSILVLVVGFMMILDKMGIQIGPILAAAGVAGIAIGFGAQRLVEDIISGFLILINDQIRVGDVIEVAGKSGLVEKVDLKMVILRDVSGSVHYIRNGKIDIVTNMTKDFSYYVADIGVAYKENIDEVIEAIKNIGEDLRNNSGFKDDILEPIEVFGLDKFADSAIIIKARIKTKPVKQWAVGREFNIRLKRKFDELNIEIPFPTTFNINQNFEK